MRFLPTSVRTEVRVTQPTLGDNSFSDFPSRRGHDTENVRDLAERTELEAFLRTAKKRHLLNVSLAEFGTAACIAGFGAIVLLVVGTQILDWYWPALLFGAG